MNSGAVLSPEAEELRRRFADAWHHSERPSLAEYIRAAPPADYRELLCRLVKTDWAARWERGEEPLIREYTELFPEHAELLGSFLSAQVESFNDSLGSTVSLSPTPQGTPNAASLPASPPSQVGRYELEEMVGRGGFGMVWRARDPELHRVVAVKVLRSDRAASAEADQELLAEARKIAQFNHPAILKIYDVLRDEERVYVVSEWMPRGPLSDHLRQFRGSYGQIAALVAKIADALHYAHLRGVVHRDVKPQNILLDEQGQPRLADFGLAVTEDEQLHENRGTLGTFAYMSPEAARGKSQYADPRTDIYSLGVVFYELLTGRLPYVAHTPEQWIEQTLEREPRPPRTIDDRIPPELEQICLKCLAKNVSDRYANARDLAEELGSFSPAARTSARPWPWIVATGVAAAALIVGAIWWAMSGPRGEGKPPEKDPIAVTPSIAVPAVSPEPDPPRGPPKAELDEFPPELDTWTQVLHRPPLKLLWSKNPETSVFQHQAEDQILHVMTPELGLLELGHTGRPALAMKTLLFQPKWEGGVGLFFGYHEDHGHSPTRVRFQAVTVERKLDNGLANLTIYRNFYQGNVLGLFTPQQTPLSAPLPIPATAQMLDLRVEGERVSIHWGEATAMEAQKETLDKVIPADYQGKFGLFILQTSAVFRNVRVMLPKKDVR